MCMFICVRVCICRCVHACMTLIIIHIQVLIEQNQQLQTEMFKLKLLLQKHGVQLNEQGVCCIIYNSYMYIYISLGTLVPNSRDRQGKLWLAKKQKTALKTTLQ